MSEHIAPVKMYFYVFFALLVLTVVTWQIAYIDLGAWNTVVALVIAVCKAALVATFFMHLRWGSSVMRLVLFAAVFWLSILITLTIGDIFTRQAMPQPQPWHATMVVPNPPPSGQMK
jgi:cytochrome c oxidase subunit IV